MSSTLLLGFGLVLLAGCGSGSQAQDAAGADAASTVRPPSSTRPEAAGDPRGVEVSGTTTDVQVEYEVYEGLAGLAAASTDIVTGRIGEVVARDSDERGGPYSPLRGFEDAGIPLAYHRVAVEQVLRGDEGVDGEMLVARMDPPSGVEIDPAVVPFPEGVEVLLFLNCQTALPELGSAVERSCQPLGGGAGVVTIADDGTAVAPALSNRSVGPDGGPRATYGSRAYRAAEVEAFLQTLE